MSDEKKSLTYELSAIFDGKGFADAKKALEALGGSSEKAEKRVTELSKELDDLQAKGGRASAAKIAAVKQELALLEKAAAAAGKEINGFAVKGLAETSKKAKETEASLSKLRAENQKLAGDIQGTAKSQNSLNGLFEESAGRIGRYTVGIGTLAASFSGGFATGVKIAQRAGVDFTESLNLMNSALDNVARALDFSFNKLAKGVSGGLGWLADKVGLDGVAQSLRDTADGFDLNIAANIRHREAMKQTAPAVEKMATAQKKLNDEVVNAIPPAKQYLATLMEQARLMEQRAGEVGFTSGAPTEADKNAIKTTISEIKQEKIAAIEATADREQTLGTLTAARWGELERQKVQATLDANIERVDLTQWAADQEIKIRQTEADMELELRAKQANATAAAMDAVGQMIGGSFTRNKAFAYASAVVNTYAAGVEAMREGDPYTKIARMIAVIAAGLAQVAKIKSTTTPNSKAQSIKIAPPKSSGGAPTPAAPSFDDPANDAVARMAGRRSASDFVNSYTSAFSSSIMSGRASYSPGVNTAPAGAAIERAGRSAGSKASGGGGITINVNAPALTPEVARQTIRELRKANQIVESKKTGGRVPGRL